MLKAKHRTGLVFFPAFDWAIDPTHPEREERLLYTQDQVFEEGLFDIEGITELKPDPVTTKDMACSLLCAGRTERDDRITFDQCRGCQNHRHGGTGRADRPGLCPGQATRTSRHAYRAWCQRILQYQY